MESPNVGWGIGADRGGAFRRAATFALALLSFPLGSCSAYVTNDGVAEANAPPPPAQVEVIPPEPYVGAVWVSGRWIWRGGRHVWTAGNYVRPRPGYVYAPHTWTAHGNRWKYQPPQWQRHRR